MNTPHSHPYSPSVSSHVLLCCFVLISFISFTDSAYAKDETRFGQNHFLAAPFSPPNNSYTDDLVVDSNDQLEGDVAVWSGDVTIEEGGKIFGNLVVMSGDIDIEAGGRVEGDVTNFRGDVTIAGKILGDLDVFSGDLTLVQSGSVSGDLSVWAGEIYDKRDSNSSASRRPNEENRSQHIEEMGISPVGRFFGALVRLLGAGVAALLIGALAGGLAMWKPQYIESVRRRLRGEMVINFAVGFLFNLVVGLLTIFFTVTCILIPMAIVTVGLLIGVNSIGWTALSASVGRRLTGYTDVSVSSTATVILGALLLTAPLAGLWAVGGGTIVGGCISVLGTLAAVGLASVGSGTVLMPWLRRLSASDEAVSAA
ncbi:MAG: polymer-forming cytoskeletal protein [Chloroflexota bacterium]